MPFFIFKFLPIAYVHYDDDAPVVMITAVLNSDDN